MDFSLFNLMMFQDNPRGIGGVVADTCEMVELAEDLGFDTAWFAEHHFTNYCLFQFGDMPLVERALGPLERIGLRPAVRALTEQAA